MRTYQSLVWVVKISTKMIRLSYVKSARLASSPWASNTEGGVVGGFWFLSTVSWRWSATDTGRDSSESVQGNGRCG
jgi:hypothetical protein